MGITTCASRTRPRQHHAGEYYMHASRQCNRHHHMKSSHHQFTSFISDPGNPVLNASDPPARLQKRPNAAMCCSLISTHGARPEVTGQSREMLLRVRLLGLCSAEIRLMGWGMRTKRVMGSCTPSRPVENRSISTRDGEAKAESVFLSSLIEVGGRGTYQIG